MQFSVGTDAHGQGSLRRPMPFYSEVTVGFGANNRWRSGRQRLQEFLC